MTQAQGNYAPSFSEIKFEGRVRPVGIGAQNIPIGNVSWQSFSGHSGSIIYLPVTSAAYLRTIRLGVFFQAVAASVKVAYTMQNPGLSCLSDAATQSGIAWVSEQTVAAGAIVPASFSVFAALRVTFQGTGEFYIMAR